MKPHTNWQVLIWLWPGLVSPHVSVCDSMVPILFFSFFYPLMFRPSLWRLPKCVLPGWEAVQTDQTNTWNKKTFTPALGTAHFPVHLANRTVDRNPPGLLWENRPAAFKCTNLNLEHHLLTHETPLLSLVSLLHCHKLQLNHLAKSSSLLKLSQIRFMHQC